MSDAPNSSEVEGLVEQWFFEAFHGSIVARSTDVWNVVHAAKDDLKQRLVELFANGIKTTPKG